MRIANERSLCWGILYGMSPDKPVVHIAVSRKFSRCVNKNQLMTIVQKVLQSARIDMPVEIGLVITGDRTIRRLNRMYRGKDEPTDVLAFHMSSQEDAEDARFVSPPDEICYLGEVIISYPQAARQCDLHRQTVANELELLITHGILHLLGYDHETPYERTRMKKKEREILAELRRD